MKKNVMMRLACFLLVAVLISTSAISGTYAKYVTTDSVNDTARVAKFGVVVTAEGSLFENTYKDAPATDDTITVESYGGVDDNVVAPGTNNGTDTFKFSITGTPEVDVKVEVKVSDLEKDVFLKAKTGLPDMTTGDEDTFNLLADYYPVKYTLKKQGTAILTDGTLADLKTALEGISVAKVDSNTNLETAFGDYEITWKWDYEGNDQADTLLGDLAAGTTLTPDVTLVDGTDYSLKTGLKIEITVTQID